MEEKKYKNTIAVYFDGGLGNQMFQYALMLNLENCYSESKITAYLKTVKKDKTHYMYELEKIFGIEIEEVENSQGFYLINVLPHEFSSEIFNLETNHNYFLRGFWQHEKYLIPIENQIREKFKFNEELYEEYKTLLEEMKEKNSVSVHIRRGDFIAGNVRAILSGYYEDAIEYMNEHLNEPTFYFFSDDMVYTKEKFAHLPRKVFVESNREENSYKDLFLMSQCQNHILNGVSTFSFWGAWLNPNKDKIVLTSSATIKCENWITWGEKDFPKKLSVEKINSDEKIHVCYALHDFDGHYSKYIGTSICSIFENTKSKVAIHIIHDETLTEENKNKFEKLAEDYKQKCQFHFVSVPDDLPFRINLEKFNDLVFQNLSSTNLNFINTDKVIAIKKAQIIEEDIKNVWHEKEVGGGYFIMKNLPTKKISGNILQKRIGAMRYLWKNSAIRSNML